MKKTTAFVLAFLLAFTVFGQKTPEKNSSVFSAKQHIGILNPQNTLKLPVSSLQNQTYNNLSTRETKQRLDSIIQKIWTNNNWETSHKETCEFDPYSNNILYFIYYWDNGSQTWIPTYKEEYSFNAQNYMTVRTAFQWDINNELWIPSNKWELTPDINGNTTVKISYFWNTGNSEWDPIYKQEMSYDSYQHLTSRVIYSWVVNTSQWVEDEKSEYVFSESGLLIGETDWNWDTNNNQWAYNHKTEYVYDNWEKLILVYFYDWDTGNNQWVYSIKEEYSYDAAGNNTLVMSYNWVTSNSTWLTSTKEVSIFNSNNKMTNKRTYSWDNNNNVWLDQHLYIFAYDFAGNRVLDESYYWDLINFMWHGQTKNTLTFNNDYTYEDLLLPYIYTGQPFEIYFSHMLDQTMRYSWNQQTHQWDVSSNSVLYYSEQNVNAIHDNPEQIINVYPNPVTDNVTFKLDNKSGTATVELFNIQGKEVLSEHFTGSSCLSLTHLTAGLYFYQLNVDGMIYNGKLIVR
jgi:hypothetical protein